MSSSLNSRIVDLVAPAARHALAGVDGVRRRVVFGLAGAPLAAWAGNDPLAGLQRWGQGSYRRFGLVIYEATLWAGQDPSQPPLAIGLDYRRTLSGRTIAEASVSEMRRLGADAAALAVWGAQMAQLFPDVQPGDRIIGIQREGGASFMFNGRPLGEIADGEFARRFFAIWLDPQSSAPELRAALLQRGGR